LSQSFWILEFWGLCENMIFNKFEYLSN
jgi:hypothetical protein